MDLRPPRPQGTPPFDFLVELEESYFENDNKEKCSLITGKMNGMQLRMYRPSKDAEVQLYTKSDNLCTADKKGILKTAHMVYHREFSNLDPRKVVHHLYGPAIALVGELFIRRTDQVAVESAKVFAGGLQDLRSLMHRAGQEGHSFGLSIFWCLFKADDPKLKKKPAITWAERLALCVEAFGSESVVPVFLDKSRCLKAERLSPMLDEIELAYRFLEGFVCEMNGKIYKVKSVRPVCLWLVAVGFTFVQGKLIPSQFMWGLRSLGHTKTFEVLLMEDMAYLFGDERSKSGKTQLSVQFVVNKNGRYSYEGDRPNYFGNVLNAHFRMMPEERFIFDKFITRKAITLTDERKLVIAQNRSMLFTECSKIMVMPDPVLGVIGCDEFWMTGSANTVGGVHFQAAKLVATKDYGHEVFQALLKRGPTPAESLVKIATTLSRDVREHACEVYGPEPPDLIYGRLFEDMKDDTTSEYDTTDRSQEYSPKESDEEDQPSKKCARFGV